ncbi:hypothetical protein ACFWOJ_38780 [Streptomyces sp. NPDC058439]|uniref:hypothetical protein n=1 Tax=Streptomyces sp. NPDC058439 TaxID=3346500 RepID=UPI00365A69BD
MYEGTAAGQTSINRSTDAALSAVFAAHSDRLTRFVYDRLGRPDWATAEDISQQVFVRLVDFVVEDRIDLDSSERFIGEHLDFLARQEIAGHDRHASVEAPTDFADSCEADRLPGTVAAEDIAVANLTVLAMLAVAA